MISICIPAYQTDPNELIKQLVTQANELSVSYQILVLDDCSPQPITIDTQEAQLIRPDNNLGSIEARKQLATHATYNHLLFLDADVALSNHDFLKQYLDHCHTDYEICYGGVTYQKNKPEPQELLRWHYGKEREAKSVKDRMNDPIQNITSAGFLIQKEVFFNIYNAVESGYGGDVLLSYQINKQGFNITHIDNPVIHLGLEIASSFITKSLNAIKTTYLAEEEGILPKDFRPVQRAYLKLDRFYITGIARVLLNVFKNRCIKNLNGLNPKILFLDLLKLNEYISLKAKK